MPITKDLLLKVAYLRDMFQKLNALNLLMQGTNSHLPHLTNQITSFTRKLEMSEQRVTEGNIDSFGSLKTFIKLHKLQNTIIPCMKAHPHLCHLTYINEAAI